MTEVVPADRTTLLQQKQRDCTAIVRSRKRKIRELFAVATVEDGIPSISLANVDAPPTNAAESKYLDASDLSKGRRFHETSIPPRSRQRPDVLRRPSTNGPNALGQKPLVPASTPAATESSRPANNASHAYTRPGVPNTPSFPPPHPASGLHAPSSPAPASPAPSRPPSAQATRSPQPPATTTPPTNGPRPILKPIDNQPAQHAKPIKTGWTETHSRPAPPPPPAVASPLVHHPSPVPGDAAQQTQTRPSPIERPEGETQPAKDGPTQSKTAPTASTRPTQEKKQLSLNVSPQDFRPTDALSSPGSTVQTATTPAINDTSANTSPDYDGPPAGDKPASGPVTNGQKESPPPTQDRTTASERPNAVGAVSKELEAQLLRDSAEAVEAKSVRIDASPSRATPPRHASSPAVSGIAPIPPPISTGDGDGGLAQKADGNTVMSEVSDAKPDIAKEVGGQETFVEATEQGTGQDTSVPEQPGSLTHINTASVAQQADRAVTRSATGTVRQKSVLEILAGDHTKASSTSRPSSSSGTQSQAPITPTSQSPRPRGRSHTDRLKSKEKSKLSTVVFGKQPKKASEASKHQVQSRPKSAGSIPSDDYFTPLFVQGFSNSNKWMKPLEQILHHAHKTVSTPDSYTQILDNQACKVLRRVYQLQQQDKWSLRQPKRCPEPTRPTSHMDVLLKEMKWMRTDFREERKWKTAVARNLAHACAEWVALSDDPDEARLLRVNAVTPATPRKPEWDGGELKWNRTDVEMTDGAEVNGAENYPTPDLVASADASSPAREEESEPDDVVLGTVAPSAIFALHDDDVVFGLHHSPNTDRLLDQLPMYGSPLKAPERDIMTPQEDPDAGWKREALPLSKYVEGRIELVESEPPRKRSRYQYAQEDDSDDEIVFSNHTETLAPLAPENPSVALFQEENKPMRDRLHAGHQFRPPNEHTMPFQSFYESRNCSQWTVNEDDELRSLVREYSYNWSLISSMLSTKSQFASGAERRTPWECFERWVMLEGLPNDMQKTQYFKLWQSRIDSAQQVIRQFNQNALAQQAQQQQAQQAQQQQAGANGPGPATPTVRKRLSLPVKVERRRNQKHMTMIDAMRKLAKKREAAIQKQQHAANSATMRKAQEQPPARVGPIKTPREYSIMRWERDQAMAERLAERMAQQQQRAAEAQRRARPAAAGAAANNANRQTQAQQIQARLQQGQQLAAATGAQMSPNPAQLGATHPHAAVARANGANQSQMGANGQARSRVVPLQGPLNGTGAQGPMSGSLAAPPLQMNGNGQMQVPVVNGQARMTINNTQQPDLATVLQAQRISEQQRQAVQLRQAQQQHPQQQQGQQPHQQTQQSQQQQHQQQHAPQSTPQQHQQQQQQQGHGMQQGNGLPQNSPPAGRAAVANGVNQKNYMSNAAQAMIASFNTSNASGGMSTPPAPSGLNMPASHSPSPRPAMTPQIHQTYIVQLQHIENQIRISHPNTPQEMVREMARQLLQNRHQNLTQSAMNAAAGGGSGQQTIANGPHQYAQLLRAQQQAQQQQAQQAQQAQSAQQSHQSQPSQQAQQGHQSQQAQQAQQTHQSQQSPQPQPQPQQNQQQQAQHAQHAQQAQQNGQQNGPTQRNSSAGSPTPPVSSVSK